VLLIVLAVVVIATAPLAGGSMSRLAEVQVRGLLLMPLALGVQILIFSVVPHWPEPVLVAGHVLSYLAAGAFVWLNRRVPGMLLAALGGAANFAAITTNGGVMPARPEALATAGLSDSAGAFENSAAATDAPLWFLGDVFAIPASWPLANVFSVGDVLLLLGVIWFVHRTSGSRLVPARLRAVAGAGSAEGEPAAHSVGAEEAPGSPKG
jgi:hypothetical protein